MGELRRYFERDGKDFSFKALAEIRHAMMAETDRLAESQPKIGTARRGPRKPGKIDVANWVLAGYFSLPPERRDELVGMGRRECERRQEVDQPIPFDPGGADSVTGARLSAAQSVDGIDYPSKASRRNGDTKPRKRG